MAIELLGIQKYNSNFAQHQNNVIMISRYWKGIVKPGQAEEYMAHLKEDTLDVIEQIDGFQSVKVLRKDGKDGVEFVVITEWESIDAIKEFAGEEYENAVVPDKARQMMVSYDSGVRHYEVVYEKL